MKIHIGCGTVYLKGFVNIDSFPKYIVGQDCSESCNTCLEANITTLDNYYKDDFGTIKDVIADHKLEIADISNKFGKGCFDEAVMLHVLEHIPTYDLDDCLSSVSDSIAKGGKLYLGVPDFDKTCKELVDVIKNEDEDKKEWYYRLLLGTQRNKWSHHYQAFNVKNLQTLLKKYGFVRFEILDNINFYPAIHINAYKG